MRGPECLIENVNRRLLVNPKALKILSAIRRFTELHGEEKREKRDRGDQEQKRENQKRREQTSQ